MLSFDEFMTERQRIWWARQRGEPQPWTDDAILASYQFTNIYRVLDRASQDVLRVVIGEQPTPIDTLLRVLLHHTFMTDATWHLLENCKALYADSYDVERLIGVMERHGGPFFHRVYKFGHFGGVYRAHETYKNRLRMIGDMIDGDLCRRLMDCSSLRAMTELWMQWPMHQAFTAYQFALDFNYYRQLPEDWAPLGPGSKRGLTLIGQKSLQEAYHISSDFPSLPSRQPSITDFEHALCEYAKYVAPHSKPNNKKYVYDARRIQYIFPSSWSIKLCKVQK